MFVVAPTIAGLGLVSGCGCCDSGCESKCNTCDTCPAPSCDPCGTGTDWNYTHGGGR